MFETRLKKNKTVIQNLEIIKGIGRYRAYLICQYLGINGNNSLSKVPTRFIDNLLTVLSYIKKQENTELIGMKELEEKKKESKEYNEVIVKVKKTYKLRTRSNLCLLLNKENTQSPEKLNNYRFIMQESLKLQNLDKNTIYSDYIKKLGIGGYIAFSLLNNKADDTPYKTMKRSRKILIEDQLKDYIKNNIHNLIKINAYRGRRLKHGYPARGQRTRTNAHTAKRLNKFL
jgi:ribosomal protein S13